MNVAAKWPVVFVALALWGCDRNAGLLVTIESENNLGMVGKLTVRVSNSGGFGQVDVFPNRVFLAGDKTTIALYVPPALQGMGVVYASASDKMTPLANGAMRVTIDPGVTTALGMCISSVYRYCGAVPDEDGGVEIPSDMADMSRPPEDLIRPPGDSGD